MVMVNITIPLSGKGGSWCKDVVVKAMKTKVFHMQQYVSNRMRVLQAAMALPVIAGMLFLSGCGRFQRTAEGSSETTRQGQEYKTSSTVPYEVKDEKGDVKVVNKLDDKERRQQGIYCPEERAPGYADILSASIRTEGDYTIFRISTAGKIPDKEKERKTMLIFSWAYGSINSGSYGLVDLVGVNAFTEEAWKQEGFEIKKGWLTKGNGKLNRKGVASDLTNRSTMKVEGQNIEVRIRDAEFPNGSPWVASVNVVENADSFCAVSYGDILNNNYNWKD